MAGSIVAAFRWSIFRISSVALIILWAFNPLGSQASFRGLHLVSSFGNSKKHVKYANPAWANDPGVSLSFGTSTSRQLYLSTLNDPMAMLQYVPPSDSFWQANIHSLGGESFAAVRSAMDPWGKVRIPTLEYLPSYICSGSASMDPDALGPEGVELLQHAR